MKNSKNYSEKVQKLYRLLRRENPKVQKVTYDDPVKALVYAIISETMTESAMHSAMKRFGEYFVDLNDLRVSRPEEIIEVLGENTPLTRNTALLLGKVLRIVFEKYNMVTLESLKKISKRPARQFLERIEGISRFVVDYCMLTSLNGHAIPLTNKMIEYLKNNQLVHPDADQDEIEGFLARQISAENAYEFYTLLRCASESCKVESEEKASREAKKAAKTKKRTKRITKKEKVGK